MYIGLDIGGTKIRGVLIDSVSKKILSKFIVLTPKSKTVFLKTLDTEIVKLIEEIKLTVLALDWPVWLGNMVF